MLVLIRNSIPKIKYELIHNFKTKLYELLTKAGPSHHYEVMSTHLQGRWFEAHLHMLQEDYHCTMELVCIANNRVSLNCHKVSTVTPTSMNRSPGNTH